MTALTEWGNFYVIVGSSAGALIGLQFVGIHNAWDTVTHLVFVGRRGRREAERNRRAGFARKDGDEAAGCLPGNIRRRKALLAQPGDFNVDGQQ
jgi:hypothetical protein